MDEILKLVSKKSGISGEEIIRKKGNLGTCEARRIFIYLAYKNYSKRQIAGFLGRTIQNIGEQINIFNCELNIYKNLREKLRGYIND